MVEAVDPERIDPPVKGEAVAQPKESQLDTESEGLNLGNLAILIEEAKKRSELRKKKGDAKKISQALEAYRQVKDFEKIQNEIGFNLDRSS